MSKSFFKCLLGLSLAFSVSCSKKVKEDQAGASEGSAAISQESMNFNAAGSDSGTLAGLNTVNFAYDSAVLDSEARQKLKTNAEWINTNSKLTIQVEGHCDSRGSVEYNLALGERRAKSVKDYLVSLGVSAKRMTIISYGKEKPLEIGDTEAVFARNRRANFVPLNN